MNEFDQHLYDRGLKQHHRCWKTGLLPDNPMDEHVVFPLLTPDGKYVGHQRYFWRRPKLRSNDEQGRYITTFLPEYKLTACFGWEYCRGYGPLFITEGIWDAIRVSNCYVDCLAVLCNNPSKQLRQYLQMLCKKTSRVLVALVDSDGPGQQLANSASYAFGPACGYKDFNDMSHDMCFERITKILDDVRKFNG